jgi:hypothetical protein
MGLPENGKDEARGSTLPPLVGMPAAGTAKAAANGAADLLDLLGERCLMGDLLDHHSLFTCVCRPQ